MSQAGKLKPNSSTITEYAWDGKNLLVQFKSGRTYQYDDVSENVFVKMASGISAGKFLNANVKGKYQESEITLAQYTALTENLWEYTVTRPAKKNLFDFSKYKLVNAVAF